MAKNQKNEHQERSQHNGVTHDEQEFTKNDKLKEVKENAQDLKQNAEGQIEEVRQAVMDHPQLVGWLSAGSGVLLLLHAFGALPLLNYVIGIIAAGLLVYGAWKINLLGKSQNLMHKMQGYVEEYTESDNKKRK